MYSTSPSSVGSYGSYKPCWSTLISMQCAILLAHQGINTLGGGEIVGWGSVARITPDTIIFLPE